MTRAGPPTAAGFDFNFLALCLSRLLAELDSTRLFFLSFSSINYHQSKVLLRRH